MKILILKPRLRDIHTELADLNKEATELARKIQENFAEVRVMRSPMKRIRDVADLIMGTSPKGHTYNERR